MQKMFKTLKVGDKIFVDKYAQFIRSIKFENGYLSILTHCNMTDDINPWQVHYYIPHNHLKANKLKLQNGIWIHLTETAYKKYMYNFIKQQLEK